MITAAPLRLLNFYWKYMCAYLKVLNIWSIAYAYLMKRKWKMSGMNAQMPSQLESLFRGGICEFSECLFLLNFAPYFKTDLGKYSKNIIKTYRFSKNVPLNIQNSHISFGKTLSKFSRKNRHFLIKNRTYIQPHPPHHTSKSSQIPKMIYLFQSVRQFKNPIVSHK